MILSTVSFCTVHMSAQKTTPNLLLVTSRRNSEDMNFRNELATSQAI